MLARTLSGTPCSAANSVDGAALVARSIWPASKAFRRSALPRKAVIVRRYALPWFGVRSGRAAISQRFSSAAKPWPTRISTGGAPRLAGGALVEGAGAAPVVAAGGAPAGAAGWLAGAPPLGWLQAASGSARLAARISAARRKSDRE